MIPFPQCCTVYCHLGHRHLTFGKDEYRIPNFSGSFYFKFRDTQLREASRGALYENVCARRRYHGTRDITEGGIMGQETLQKEVSWDKRHYRRRYHGTRDITEGGIMGQETLQKEVSWDKRHYIPQTLWAVITFPCPWYLLLLHKFTCWLPWITLRYFDWNLMEVLLLKQTLDKLFYRRLNAIPMHTLPSCGPFY